MDVINFPGCNTTYAENQPEYLPLRCHKSTDGEVTSCWQFSFWERIKIAFTGKIYLQVLTFNHPLQPLKMVVDPPVFDNARTVPGPPNPPRARVKMVG